MEIYSMDIAELQQNLNLAKDYLATELDLPQLNDIVIMVAKPSMLGRFTRFIAGQSNKPCFYVLRLAKKPKDD